MPTPIWFAVFGGLMINVLNLIELQRVPRAQRPDFGDPLYWLPFVVWPLVGGVLAFAYTAAGSPLNLVLALNVGMSAPLILKAMVAAVPAIPRSPINPGQGA